MHAIAHGVLRTQWESLHWKLTLGEKFLAAPRNRICVSGVPVRCSTNWARSRSCLFSIFLLLHVWDKALRNRSDRPMTYSPDVLLRGWLGSKHQLTNYPMTYDVADCKKCNDYPQAAVILSLRTRRHAINASRDCSVMFTPSSSSSSSFSLYLSVILNQCQFLTASLTAMSICMPLSISLPAPLLSIFFTSPIFVIVYVFLCATFPPLPCLSVCCCPSMTVFFSFCHVIQ